MNANRSFTVFTAMVFLIAGIDAGGAFMFPSSAYGWLVGSPTWFSDTARIAQDQAYQRQYNKKHHIKRKANGARKHNPQKSAASGQYKVLTGPAYKGPQAGPVYNAPQIGPAYQAPQVEKGWQPPQSGPAFQAPQTGPAFHAPQTGPSFQAPKVEGGWQPPQVGPGYQAPGSN